METLRESLLKNIRQDDESVAKEKIINFLVNWSKVIPARENRIKKSKIKLNKDFSIVYDGNIYWDDAWAIANKSDRIFPDYIKFDKILGNFELWGTLLNGCPEYVDGTFRYVGSHLKGSAKNLVGAPKRVLSCEITNCQDLESLEGAPEVERSFICTFNRKLKTLKGAPEKVSETFSCATCISLESLEGGPKGEVKNYNCGDNLNLKTLKGAPEKVTYNFDCSFCPSLESLEYGPKTTHTYDCRRNKEFFSVDDVEKYTNVEKTIFYGANSIKSK